LYRDWLDPVGQFETKNSRVEIEFVVQRAFDVLCLPESVLLAGKRDVRNWYSLRAHGLDHLLRLVRRHDFVFQALKKDHRTREPLGKVNRRPFKVDVLALWIRPEQAGEVLRLVLVRVASQCFGVADTEVARAGFERRAKSYRT